jgi:hypothetical protein
MMFIGLEKPYRINKVFWIYGYSLAITEVERLSMIAFETCESVESPIIREKHLLKNFIWKSFKAHPWYWTYHKIFVISANMKFQWVYKMIWLLNKDVLARVSFFVPLGCCICLSYCKNMNFPGLIQRCDLHFVNHVYKPNLNV